MSQRSKSRVLADLRDIVNHNSKTYQSYISSSITTTTATNDHDKLKKHHNLGFFIVKEKGTEKWLFSIPFIASLQNPIFIKDFAHAVYKNVSIINEIDLKQLKLINDIIVNSKYRHLLVSEDLRPSDKVVIDCTSITLSLVDMHFISNFINQLTYLCDDGITSDSITCRIPRYSYHNNNEEDDDDDDDDKELKQQEEDDDDEDTTIITTISDMKKKNKKKRKRTNSEDSSNDDVYHKMSINKVINMYSNWKSLFEQSEITLDVRDGNDVTKDRFVLNINLKKDEKENADNERLLKRDDGGNNNNNNNTQQPDKNELGEQMLIDSIHVEEKRAKKKSSKRKAKTKREEEEEDNVVDNNPKKKAKTTKLEQDVVDNNPTISTTNTSSTTATTTTTKDSSASSASPAQPTKSVKSNTKRGGSGNKNKKKMTNNSNDNTTTNTIPTPTTTTQQEMNRVHPTSPSSSSSSLQTSNDNAPHNNIPSIINTNNDNITARDIQPVSPPPPLITAATIPAVENEVEITGPEINFLDTNFDMNTTYDNDDEV